MTIISPRKLYIFSWNQYRHHGSLLVYHMGLLRYYPHLVLHNHTYALQLDPIAQ